MRDEDRFLPHAEPPVIILAGNARAAQDTSREYEIEQGHYVSEPRLISQSWPRGSRYIIGHGFWWLHPARQAEFIARLEAIDAVNITEGSP